MAAIGFDVPTERVVCQPVGTINIESMCTQFHSEYLVVKPAYEESSLALSLVKNEGQQVCEAIAKIQCILDDPVLVQEYVEGFDVAVPLVGRSKPSCLPAVVLQHDLERTVPFVFDADAKATKSEVYYEPMDVWPASIRRCVYDMALAAFKLADLRDYARLDCRVTDTGKCYFLEINANPQLGLDKASFAVSAFAVGMTVGEVVANMVNRSELPYGSSPLDLGY